MEASVDLSSPKKMSPTVEEGSTAHGLPMPTRKPRRQQYKGLWERAVHAYNVVEGLRAEYSARIDDLSARLKVAESDNRSYIRLTLGLCAVALLESVAIALLLWLR